MSHTEQVIHHLAILFNNQDDKNIKLLLDEKFTTIFNNDITHDYNKKEWTTKLNTV